MADKKRMSFNDLLMDNRFVFVISLLAAIVLWGMVSMTLGDAQTRVIENVRVTIDEDENSAYKMFGYEETFVDVTVKGKKYLVSGGALTSDDISVTATGSYVDSAGMKKLKLSATIDKSSEIKITNISKSNIEVFFDVPKVGIFPVEAQIKAEKDIVPEGYTSEEAILSVSTVTVSGPATEINRIDKLMAVAKISEPLKETTELKVNLSPISSDGKKIRYIKYDENAESITMTVPVSKVKEIPLSVRYVNIPEYYRENMPEVNIYPQKLKVSAAESVLDSLETINVGTINFSELKNINNKFTFAVENIDEVRVLDDVKSVKVNVNCYPMDEKTISVKTDSITLLNVPAGKTASLLSGEIKDVKVIGPAQELNNIKAGNVFAKVDLSDATAGTDSYTASVYIKGSDKCWVYGSYTVSVKVQ